MAGSGLVRTVVVFSETPGRTGASGENQGYDHQHQGSATSHSPCSHGSGAGAPLAEGMDALLCAADERRVDGDSPTDTHGRARRTPT